MKPLIIQNNISYDDEIAIVDLGSNSFHLMIIKIIDNQPYIIDRMKKKVQLANGLSADNILLPHAMERGLLCLANFAERLNNFATSQVITIATYTLRQAVNNNIFLQQAKNIYPFDIQIINGQTEAQFIYYGISSYNGRYGNKLVIDIGGGSTEIVIGNGLEILYAQSLNIGSVYFSKKYFTKNVSIKEAWDIAYTQAISQLSELKFLRQSYNWQFNLGSAGTIKVINNMVNQNFNNIGIITLEHLDKLIAQITRHQQIKDVNINGINYERRDVLMGGLVILKALFSILEIHQIEYTDGALREGIIFSLLKKEHKLNLKENTTKHLVQQFNIDHRYTNQANQILQQLTRNKIYWQRPEQAAEMLEILRSAVRLYRLGYKINYHNSKQHSLYILEHCNLLGFSKEQKNLLKILINNYQHKITFFSNNSYHYKDILKLIVLMRFTIILNQYLYFEPNWQESFSLSFHKDQQVNLTLKENFIFINKQIFHQLKQEKFTLSKYNLYLQLSSMK